MKYLTAAVLLGVVVLSACAPGTPGRSGTGEGGVSAAAPEPARTLVMGMRVEPISLANRALESPGIAPAAPGLLFNALLVATDEQGRPHPYLTEALPQLNNDTWRVFPDGRMEATYRLHPNLTWHDGAPLTADDFVFAWEVYRTPELGTGATLPPVSLMADVVAADARTLVIHWSKPYTEAGSVPSGKNGYAPLPRHLLDGSYRAGRWDAFAAHPYWTTQFVGAGPYRLDRWEAGAYIEASGFPGYVWGPPAIDRIRLTFIPDQNTALANLLAGEIHVALDSSINFQHGVVLKREWGPRDGGSVWLAASKSRFVEIQFKPEYTSPGAILDLRVRKALAHAIDKQGLSDGLLEGESGAADMIIAPHEEYFQDAERVITRYPYDLRRAEQLMTEAGFRRTPGGFFTSTAGERFNPSIWATGGDPGESELAILADGWRRAGLDAVPYVIPPARAQEPEVVSTYPAFRIEQTGVIGENPLSKVVGTKIATAANRWAGSNRGGWQSPEYDRLYDTFVASLDRSKRNQAGVLAMKMISEELPILPMYYGFEVVANTSQVRGPRSGETGAALWRVHEWRWN